MSIKRAPGWRRPTKASARIYLVGRIVLDVSVGKFTLLLLLESSPADPSSPLGVQVPRTDIVPVRAVPAVADLPAEAVGVDRRACHADAPS
jgi:hypothetical protein